MYTPLSHGMQPFTTCLPPSYRGSLMGGRLHTYPASHHIKQWHRNRGGRKTKGNIMLSDEQNRISALMVFLATPPSYATVMCLSVMHVTLYHITCLMLIICDACDPLPYNRLCVRVSSYDHLPIKHCPQRLKLTEGGDYRASWGDYRASWGGG